MSAKLTKSKQPCPSCTSSDAYHEWSDGHGYCFSCRKYFRGGSHEDGNYTYEFLPWRGVTKETMEFYGVKTKIAPNGEPVSIGFPYSKSSFKVRHLGRKDFYSTGEIASAGLFGIGLFEPGGRNRYVTITEGELDALSLYQCLKGPVVSVQSSGSAKRDCTICRSWLNSFDRIYLAFDSDRAGRDAAAAVASLFDYNRVYQVKFGKYKDANGYVEAGELELLKGLWWNSKQYLPETIVSSIQDFSDILTEETPPGIPYPFPTLSDMTYGIRPYETVLLTAQEGVGKTEIMHAIEFKLLKETSDAIGAIYLEETKRRHLQSIASLELGKPAHLPDSGVTVGETLSAVERVISSDERLFIYSHYGSDDPEVLLDTIRYMVSARSCRYILLDHVTMVVSGLAGEDERRALDYLVTRLEMMVQELGFALILVSHVNDFGQTRGSRYISKIAHTRIDISRDVASGSNLTYIFISKNRFGAKTGPAGVLEFNPLTWSYTELTNEQLAASAIPRLGSGSTIGWQGSQGALETNSKMAANDNSFAGERGAVA